MLIRNVNPLGAVEVPLLGQVVDRDATVDVDQEEAERLLPQRMNWAPADEASQAVLDQIAQAERDAADAAAAEEALRASEPPADVVTTEGE